MKSLDRISLEEQTRLVSRYVAGDLSRSERAEFESWLVASPELAAEVEMERRLRRGIASAARRGWIKSGAAATPAAPDRRWQAALAASVLLSLALGLSLALPTRKDEAPTVAKSRNAPQPVAASLTVRLGSVRGGGNLPDITLAKAEAPRQLVLEPDVVVLTCEDGSFELECPGGNAPQTPQYSEYEVDLVRRGDAVVAWRSARNLPAGSQLSFTLQDPGGLEAGDYDVLVRGRSPDHEEIVARFLMRIH